MFIETVQLYLWTKIDYQASYWGTEDISIMFCVKCVMKLADAKEKKNIVGLLDSGQFLKNWPLSTGCRQEVSKPLSSKITTLKQLTATVSAYDS